MKSCILPIVAVLLVSTVSAANTKVSTFDGLRSALIQAVDGDTITLASGTYNASSQIEVTVNDVTLMAENANDKPVLDAGATNRIMKVTGSRLTVVGISFKNGFTTSYGGAIRIDGAEAVSTVKIVDCEFVDCVAKLGGAIFAHDDVHEDYGPRSAYGLVSGCTFTRCATEWTDMWNAGGAIYGSLWVEDSLFDACSVDPDVSRGQTSIAATSHMTVTNCVFKDQQLRQNVRGLVGTTFDLSNNDCAHGAARLLGCTMIGNELASSSAGLFYGRVCIDRCVISNTTTTITTEAETGGNLPSLYQSPNRAASSISSTLFIDNKCPFKMGSVPALVNCTFVRNVGGLAYYQDDSAETVITNCVFWGNIAKTKWPWNRVYKGVPGFYWCTGTSLPENCKLANTIIEGGTANDDVAAVLATEVSGESTRLTDLAATKGPGFTDMAKGDFSLKRSSILVDAGVKADWMDSACDIAGNRRCLKKGLVSDGALPDIGCYEFFAVAGFKISLR